MAKRNSWSNQGRFEGKSGLISMGLAVFLSISSITVAAQTVFEFEDPLAETRAQIERTTTDGAAQVAPVAKPERVSGNANVGPTTDVKGPITVFAERAGLTTAGLVGLGFLALLALGLGLMWLLGRRNAQRASQRTDRELYALSDGARGRRTLESGARVTRNRKKFLDTTEEGELTTKPSAARKAARILSTKSEPDFVPEEENHIQQDQAEDDAYMLAYEAVPEKKSPARASAAVDPGDPGTWRRPNLDRLKSSIKDDWVSKKEEPIDPEAEELRKEAEAFADLFGDEKPAAKATVEPTRRAKSPVLDMLDNAEDDSEAMSVSALQAAVEKTADVQPRPTKARSGGRPDRSDALRRIRALRESVKAS